MVDPPDIFAIAEQLKPLALRMESPLALAEWSFQVSTWGVRVLDAFYEASMCHLVALDRLGDKAAALAWTDEAIDQQRQFVDLIERAAFAGTLHAVNLN